jgi:hypothetical protein
MNISKGQTKIGFDGGGLPFATNPISDGTAHMFGTYTKQKFDSRIQIVETV